MNIETFKERLEDLIQENEELMTKWRAVSDDQAGVIEEENEKAITKFLKTESFLVATGQSDIPAVPPGWQGKCFVRVRWDAKDSMFTLADDQRGTVVGELLTVMLGGDKFTPISPDIEVQDNVSQASDDTLTGINLSDRDFEEAVIDYSFPKGLRE